MNKSENILIQLDNDVTNEQFKSKLENIAREYSLAVIEGQEVGRKYPDASDNLRFLNDLIFDLDCVIEQSAKQ